MRHIALYCRTSTLSQDSGLESQERALRAYCEANGIKNFVVYSDLGVSGTKASRPELDKLMSAVESDQVSAVIVYSFSRFARSVKHLLTALEVFEANKVSFISISENLDTKSSTGRFVFTILAALAAMEREILVDRVKCGLMNAKSKGVVLGRKRKRPSELIQSLHAKGFSYRQISKLAKCSISTVSEELNESRSVLTIPEQKRQFA